MYVLDLLTRSRALRVKCFLTVPSSLATTWWQRERERCVWCVWCVCDVCIAKVRVHESKWVASDGLMLKVADGIINTRREDRMAFDDLYVIRAQQERNTAPTPMVSDTNTVSGRTTI